MPQDKEVWGYETLWAEVKDASDGTKVWALVKEPGRESGSLREVPLVKVQEARFEAGFFFSKPGTYEVNTYVQDPNGLIDYDQTRYFHILFRLDFFFAPRG